MTAATRRAAAKPNEISAGAPYNRDPKLWTKSKWTDVHCGKSFAITTKLPAHPGLVRVKSIRDVYEDYKHHPESKSADTSGKPASRRTCGLLERLHVHALSLTYLGKESNLLEDVENETVHDWDDVQQEYRDQRGSLLNANLRKIPSEQLAREVGISARAIRAIRNGRSRPTARTRELLVRAAKHLEPT